MMTFCDFSSGFTLLSNELLLSVFFRILRNLLLFSLSMERSLQASFPFSYFIIGFSMSYEGNGQKIVGFELEDKFDKKLEIYFLN